jgi:hypothetical protein
MNNITTMSNTNSNTTNSRSNSVIIVIDKLEKRNSDLENQIVELDQHLYTNKLRLQEISLEYALNLELLIDNNPQNYPYPKSCIFSTLLHKFKKKGINQYTINQIYEIFKDPQYDKYKPHIYNRDKNKNTTPANTPPTNNTNNNNIYSAEKQAIDSQVFDKLYFIESNIDHPQIQTFLEKQVKQIKKEDTKQRKEKEDSEKVTIPTPNETGRTSALYEAIRELINTLDDVSIRVWKYPPTDPQDDQYYAEGVSIMSDLLVPGTDLKYVRDTLSYFDIIFEMKTQSIHSAMSKSKIRTPSGKWRKVTREQIADIEPQILLLALQAIEKIPWLFRLFIYLATYQKPYTGEFHLDRHDKLSESAFGKSSFVD